MVAGSATFAVTLNSVGIFSITASDVTDPTRTAGSATGITVAAGVPSAPRSVAGTNGQASGTVTWQAPASSGGQPVLELNPRHPLIRRIAERAAAGEDVGEAAQTLVDLAHVQGGDPPRDPVAFARRVAAALAQG